MSRTPLYKGGRWIALVCILMVLLALGGCAAPAQQTPEVTHAPELLTIDEPDDGLYEPPAITPNESLGISETREVALYYRMQGENLLACETRAIWLPKDKQVEEVLVEALIGGPSPGLLELSGLFSSGTKIAKTWHNDDLLTITLSQQFLDPPAGAPVDWESDAAWRTEVLTRRQLALASIVNTITEETNYTSVQFLVVDWGEETTGRRLLRGELYEDAESDQLLAPVVRSEHFILTHNNTANLLMQCWRSQSYERIYRFVAQESTRRPTEAAFRQEMVEMNRPLLSFSVSAGMVAESGQKAIMEVSYDYHVDGQMVQVRNYPMRLVRENGIWKITYADLMRLMEAL